MTAFYDKASNAIINNPGKASASVGGGISFVLALALFASKDRVEMLEKRLVDEHVERMNLEQTCEAREKGCVERFAKMMLRPGRAGTKPSDENP